jgi:gamma-glutamylcyclotransferase (GGCT)/AIG2-like uncharacterized protein YtfP
MNVGDFGLAPDTETVFVYGTLLAPEIVHAVMGRVPASQPAVLHGYARYTVKQQVYPGVIEQKGAVVDGALYRGMQPDEWRRLDEYEGALYVRRAVEVNFGPGTVRTQCYVVPRESASSLSTEPWDLQRFMREHSDTFGDTWD